MNTTTTYTANVAEPSNKPGRKPSIAEVMEAMRSDDKELTARLLADMLGAKVGY